MSIAISHIRHIGLLTTDAAAHARFYSQLWGLQVVNEEGGAIYLRGSSPEFYLLSLRTASRKGIHHIAFAMPSDETIRRAADELLKAGVQLIQAPGLLDEPGGGYGCRFIDPDGR